MGSSRFETGKVAETGRNTPKVIRMNYLQDASDDENDYAEGEQNNSVGND